MYESWVDSVSGPLMNMHYCDKTCGGYSVQVVTSCLNFMIC